MTVPTTPIITGNLNAFRLFSIKGTVEKVQQQYGTHYAVCRHGRPFFRIRIAADLQVGADTIDPAGKGAVIIAVAEEIIDAEVDK